jgi:hypothetical protein
MARKYRLVREGKNALVAESTILEGEELLGQWLDVPFLQDTEEGVMELFHNGKPVKIPVEHLMFRRSDFVYT